MNDKERADRLLVALGHYESRAAAQAAISAGCVSVNGERLAKASTRISGADAIEASHPHPWVSRGGLKLDHALNVFGVEAAGKTCLDIGASTGGFTDVLLARGAAHVIAVDVGRDQLHSRIAGDPRVSSLEGCDARDLLRDNLAEAPPLIVCDASFISLEKLLERPLSLARQGADLVTLFKPQFQVGRANIGKGGIVTDQGAIQRAEQAFCDWLEGRRWRVLGRTDSPISGGDGNAERLIHAKLKAGES
ncbi:MAG: TlyA family RNA methyltransferase [Henriciella sp.]|uniref:TlyA family RNA methyltransferase n=1 Tax=Henriciella sp. TaxID=1968823 RepID=UPI003C736817